MIYQLRGLLSLTGRVFLCAIFFMSAVANKIPNYDKVVDYMSKAGVPEPRTALAGAIVFLILGSLAIIFGCYARCGALLLLVFLIAATYYFHAFWRLPEGQERQTQTIQFMKNCGLMGAMLLILANGPGPWSLSGKASRD